MNKVKSLKQQYKQLIKERLNDYHKRFTYGEIRLIDKYCLRYEQQLPQSRYTVNINKIKTKYTPKPLMDGIIIKLFNEIMGNKWDITNINELDIICPKYIEWYDKKYPNGKGSSVEDDIRFMVCFSKSGLMGIQSPKTSRSACESLLKGLNSHNNSKTSSRFKIIEDNFNDYLAKIEIYPEIMRSDYSDVMMNAKQSSSSVSGDKRTFRDWVFEHTYRDIMKLKVGQIPYVIYFGSRLDKRGKFRMICSFNANIRIIDHLLTSGTYNLFKPKTGILRDYTTDGLDITETWKRMKQMVPKDPWVSICTDYSAYDAQFGPYDYIRITHMLNKHRFDNSDIKHMYDIFEDFMTQPKPLIMSGGGKIKDEVIMNYFHTLPSGCKSTHSYENILGICTHLDMIKRGIRIKMFQVNGDDQNALLHKDDYNLFEDYMEEKRFEISLKKSLAKHKLSIWSKKWYSVDLEPTSEIGSIRGLTEIEGQQLTDIKESKIFANYGSILKIGMILIKLNKPDHIVYSWLKYLSRLINVDCDRIPITLNEINTISSSNIIKNEIPVGLLTEKTNLQNKLMPFKILNAGSFYDLLKMSYMNNQIIVNEPKEIKYYDDGYVGSFKPNHDYRVHNDSEIPFHMRNVVYNESETQDDYTSRQFINSTGSYDGPLDFEFQYKNMLTLCKAILERNKYAWSKI